MHFQFIISFISEFEPTKLVDIIAADDISAQEIRFPTARILGSLILGFTAGFMSSPVLDHGVARNEQIIAEITTDHLSTQAELLDTAADAGETFMHDYSAARLKTDDPSSSDEIFSSMQRINTSYTIDDKAIRAKIDELLQARERYETSSMRYRDERQPLLKQIQSNKLNKTNRQMVIGLLFGLLPFFVPSIMLKKLSNKQNSVTSKGVV